MSTPENQTSIINETLIDVVLDSKESEDELNKQLAIETLAFLNGSENQEENSCFVITRYDQEKKNFICLYDEFNLDNKEAIDKFNNIKPLIDNNKDVYVLPKKALNDFNDIKIHRTELIPIINLTHKKLNISIPNLSPFASDTKIENFAKDTQINKNNNTEFVAPLDDTSKPTEVKAKFSNVNELVSSLEEEKKYFKHLDAKFTKRDALISGSAVFVGLSVSSSLIVGGLVGLAIYILARKFFPEKNKDIKLLDAQILLLKEAANSVLAKKMIENNPSLNYKTTLNNLMKSSKNTDVEFTKDIQDRFLELTHAHNIEFNRKIFMQVRHRFNAKKTLSK